MKTTADIDFATINLQDALDLAVLVEEEARDRYAELADQLTQHRTPDAAAFFWKMERVEELHRKELAEQRSMLFGDAPVRVTRSMIFDIEAPEYDEARAFMTRRQALETAMRSEVKAHDFFEAALPHLKSDDVRKLFTDLRDEELEHQRFVKAELARLGPEDAGKVSDYEDGPAPQ